jgi:hypothetical protein
MIYIFGFIVDLEVTLFMTIYRSFFPQSSIIPKMHFLEDHLIDWVKRYRTGFGLLGEQGVESIHHEFNTLKNTYSSIRNRVEQLKCIVEEHHRRCHPDNIVIIPPINARKKVEE